MPDDPSNPQPPPTSSPQHVPLNVLPNSGKLDELRHNPPTAPAPVSKKLVDQNVIDRLLDQTRTPQQKAITEKVIDVLRTVFDPEIPVNIYELGLIYDIRVAADNKVDVKMTLTAPGCPVAGQIIAEVETKIENIPEVPVAAVELVWDPPWTRERMSEAALLELGLM
jgi:FeS assembly SUF system protein